MRSSAWAKRARAKWEQIPYDQAIQEVADKLNQIKAESGAEAIASAGGTTRTDDFARRRFLNLFGTPSGFPTRFCAGSPPSWPRPALPAGLPFETDLGTAALAHPVGLQPRRLHARRHARLHRPAEAGSEDHRG